MRNKTKLYQYIFRTTFISFCLITILVSTTQIFPQYSSVFAEGNNTVSSSSSAHASVTVAATCSLSVTRSNGYSNDNGYTGILANNSNIEILGSIFTTYCNDIGGYAIYAIGYTNNEYGNTDLIYNNEPTSTYNIKTDGDTSAGGNSSNWKMKLSPVENSFTPTIENNYNNYSNIPSNYTKIASYNNVTINDSDSTTGSSITATYQATASGTQPAGTYTGQVKYTMVHPGIITSPSTCPANNICYSANADGPVNGSMGNQTIAVDATSATLLASNFWRTGYGFAGWNTEYDGSGTFYGPNEDIEFTAGQYSNTNGGLFLYAVWVKSTGYLQDWHGCQSLTTTIYNSTTGKLEADLSSITALTDKRDNQTYAVARLADGNCWMIENLRLEAEGTIGNNINDPSVTNESLSQGYGGAPGVYGSFVGLANPETANFSDSTTPNSIYKSDGSFSTYNPLTNPATLEDIGTTNSPGYRMPRYRNTNTSSPANNPTTGNANIYSYGNYYTWAAAIADTTYYDEQNGHTTVETSICPKGWHLPHGNSGNSSTNLGNISGGFYYLATQLNATNGANGSKTWRSFPNNFLYSGSAYYHVLDVRGMFGRYWSSSAVGNSTGQSYTLSFNNSNISPGNSVTGKFSGFVIRCIAE